ncbi:MAG: hypothetical protein QOD06_676, partial [Candidatus Binatota bacterium]|nr:hypothetical protein [Candidatus Binatota bacterium]
MIASVQAAGIGRRITLGQFIVLSFAGLAILLLALVSIFY